jgi:hypothetical protein
VFGRRGARRRWAGPLAVMAAVAGIALAAALVRMPSAPRNGQVVVMSSPSPTGSVAYVTVSPGHPIVPPSGVPPRDGPLPPDGTCPGSVNLMRLPIINPFDPTTWPHQVTAVTLCRYSTSSFDTSAGHNILVQGPVRGDLPSFASALAKALPPVRPLDHAGCRIVNSGPPYTVDLVFVTAADDTGKAYMMLREVCDPPWLEDPEWALREAVDAILGPPY